MAATYDEYWANLEKLLQAGLPIRQAWDNLIDFHSSALPAGYWGQIRALDVEADQPELAAWMEKLVTDSPLPSNIVAIWLGITKLWYEDEEKEYYAVYMAGADNYDADDAEWACDPACFPANKYFIPDVPYQADEIIRGDEENYALLDWILPLAYTALAVNDIIKTQLDKSGFLKHQQSIPVTVGFDGGDFINIGAIV